MKKTDVRREFFKLKNRGFSYAQCKRILKAGHDYDTTTRSLKRWVKRLDLGDWDLQDKSRKPHVLHYKINQEIESKIIALRNKTGWGCDKIADHLLDIGISTWAINKILNKHDLCRMSKNKGKQKKWIRWQRHHPNSLWQIDHTDEQELFDCYTLSVLDDFSRYSIALVKLRYLSTDIVTHTLDEIIRVHGKPKQILSDNGSVYGLKSQNSKFDRWCRKRGIQHIRTKVHSPSTNGKVERLFRTMDDELPFCNNDLELFRLRYNHFRPHSSLNGQTPAKKYHDFANLF